MLGTQKLLSPSWHTVRPGRQCLRKEEPGRGGKCGLVSGFSDPSPGKYPSPSTDTHIDRQVPGRAQENTFRSPHLNPRTASHKLLLPESVFLVSVSGARRPCGGGGQWAVSGQSMVADSQLHSSLSSPSSTNLSLTHAPSAPLSSPHSGGAPIQGAGCVGGAEETRGRGWFRAAHG